MATRAGARLSVTDTFPALCNHKALMKEQFSARWAMPRDAREICGQRDMFVHVTRANSNEKAFVYVECLALAQPELPEHSIPFWLRPLD